MSETTDSFAEKKHPIYFTLAEFVTMRQHSGNDNLRPFVGVDGYVRELDIYTILTAIASMPGVSTRRRDEMLNVYFNIKDDLRAEPPV